MTATPIDRIKKQGSNCALCLCRWCVSACDLFLFTAAAAGTEASQVRDIDLHSEGSSGHAEFRCPGDDWDGYFEGRAGFGVRATKGVSAAAWIYVLDDEGPSLCEI
jgi:methylaspartate ammonia-lyase